MSRSQLLGLLRVTLRDRWYWRYAKGLGYRINIAGPSSRNGPRSLFPSTVVTRRRSGLARYRRALRVTSNLEPIGL